jgi:hypothetical protein
MSAVPYFGAEFLHMEEKKLFCNNRVLPVAELPDVVVGFVCNFGKELS